MNYVHVCTRSYPYVVLHDAVKNDDNPHQAEGGATLPLDMRSSEQA